MRFALDLRTRLLAFVILATCGVLAASEWNDYRSAGVTAQIVHDTILLASARQIAETVRVQDGVLEALIPPSAIERLSNSQRDRVVYRVAAPSGELLAGYADVPLPKGPVTSIDPIWYDAAFRGMPVRAVAIGQPIAGQRSDLASVVVGETLNGRGIMELDLWAGTVWREALTWGIVAILAYLGLRSGLAPLMRLRKVIMARDPQSLALLDAVALPSELQPFVAALNAAITRVSQQMEQKQRLLVDAAHQLRTPLAVLQMQAAVGLRGESRDAKDEALSAMAVTVGDMTRLANQLLTLARVEAEGEGNIKQTSDLLLLVRRVLAAQGVRALEKNIGLELEAPDGSFPVHANAVMAAELVANLVDNAVQYTPAGGSVAIALSCCDSGFLLRVADTGPGIPDGEREKVFQRFYRVPGSCGDGSGLGLAIAAEIARTHGGRIVLGAPTKGSGLVADLWLPAAAPAPSSPGSHA